MLSNQETEKLAQKHILLLLKEVNALTAAEAQLVINKLVSVAAKSMEAVSDTDAAIEMLDSIKFNTSAKQMTVNHIRTGDSKILMRPHSTVQ